LTDRRGIHPNGEGRDAWATDEERTTLLILNRGRFRLDLSVASITLEQEGDHAVWGPGIDHSWRAEEDSTVITVRWPTSAPPSASHWWAKVWRNWWGVAPSGGRSHL
jgi:hypothetical protein